MVKDKYIDITFPVSKDLPIWPGSVGLKHVWHLKLPKDGNNLSSFCMDNHMGTHLDAPLHFIENGKAVHQLDLNKLIGEVYVAEIRGVKSISKRDLEKAQVPDK